MRRGGVGRLPAGIAARDLRPDVLRHCRRCRAGCHRCCHSRGERDAHQHRHGRAARAGNGGFGALPVRQPRAGPVPAGSAIRRLQAVLAGADRGRSRGQHSHRPDLGDRRSDRGCRGGVADAPAAVANLLARPSRRVAESDRDALERPQRAQPRCLGAGRRAARPVHAEPHRREHLRVGQLPDWRRPVQPERDDARRRAGQHVLRQPDRAGAHAGRSAGIQDPDQQPGRRIRAFRRRRDQHDHQVRQQRVPRLGLRVPPQPGSQRQHLL